MAPKKRKACGFGQAHTHTPVLHAQGDGIYAGLGEALEHGELEAAAVRAVGAVQSRRLLLGITHQHLGVGADGLGGPENSENGGKKKMCVETRSGLSIGSCHLWWCR